MKNYNVKDQLLRTENVTLTSVHHGQNGVHGPLVQKHVVKALGPGQECVHMLHSDKQVHVVQDNQRRQKPVMKIHVYLIQSGQIGLNGQNVVKLVEEVPKIGTVLAKYLEMGAHSRTLRTNPVLDPQQWSYSVMSRSVHQKQNGVHGVHGANVVKIAEAVNVNEKGNVTKLKGNLAVMS